MSAKGYNVQETQFISTDEVEECTLDILKSYLFTGNFMCREINYGWIFMKFHVQTYEEKRYNFFLVMIKCMMYSGYFNELWIVFNETLCAKRY